MDVGGCVGQPRPPTPEQFISSTRFSQAVCVCLADAAGCVAASSLKHMLNSQDALLGPWLPGRDMLEDELRTFVGECFSYLHTRQFCCQ